MPPTVNRCRCSCLSVSYKPSNPHPVLPSITGLGLITPLGHDVESTWAALLAGRAIDDHSRVTLPGVPDGLRVNELAARVARQAIEHAGWGSNALHDHRTALVVGTSKGPVEDWICAPCPTSDKPSLIHGLSDTATAVAREIGVGAGPKLTLSAACASGLHALIRACMLLHAGSADRAIVVAAEASVHPLFLSSFARLGVLPPPGVRCRPYDQTRAGFLMSDAAAAVCIDASGIGPVVIESFAIGADATHLTGTDADGVVLRRLIRSCVNGQQVDLVHGHGTGTEVNDPVELAAVESCVRPEDAKPSLYSHKGSIGHTLGASGLISVVLNCLCHHYGTVPPMPRLFEPLEASRLCLQPEAVHRPIRRSLAIAAGFGGAIATVTIRSNAQR